MPNWFVNLSLLAQAVGMTIYHGRLHFRHRLAFRLAFLAFWLLLGVEMASDDRWLLIPAVICLVCGI